MNREEGSGVSLVFGEQKLLFNAAERFLEFGDALFAGLEFGAALFLGGLLRLLGLIVLGTRCRRIAFNLLGRDRVRRERGALGIGFFLEVVVVVADIVHKTVLGQVQNTGRGAVDEIAVVGHIEHRARKGADGALQDFLALHVEMVGRLVEEQKIRVREHEFCE